jgi:hypothetical protein
MLKKAKLFEIEWQGKKTEPTKVKGSNDIEIQFNPQTLKLTYSNENKGGDQSGGSAKQFVGKGTTKLSVELFFDTTQQGTDVRYWTGKVGYFMRAKDKPKVPPGISFEWGNFNFSGTVDSLQETLDYFSEEGVPLRATIALGITRQDIVFPTEQETGKPGASLSGKPGNAPLNIVRDNGNGRGDNMPKMMGREGNSGDWKAIAAANNIDNPLRLKPGMLLDLNAGASARAGVSLGAQGGISASAGISGGIGFSAGLGGGVGFGGGVSAGAGFGAGAGISGGASAGAGFSAGAGAGISGGVSAGAGIGASASVSGGIGGSISGSASAQAGVSGRANVVAGGGFGAGVDRPGR